MIYPVFCVMSSLFNSSHSNILMFNRLNRNVMSLSKNFFCFYFHDIILQLMKYY